MNKLIKIGFSLFLAGLSLFLVGCQLTGTGASQPAAGFVTTYPESSEYYLKLAETAKPPAKQTYELHAAGRLLQDHNFSQAEEVLNHISSQLPENLKGEKALLQANLATQQNRGQKALADLRTIKNPDELPTHYKIAYYQISALAHLQLREPLQSAKARLNLDPLLESDSAREQNHRDIWSDLNQIPEHDLAKEAARTNTGQLQGWLQIVYITKKYADIPTTFRKEVEQWQHRFPQHPANRLLPEKAMAAPAVAQVAPPTPSQGTLRVALLLPITGKLAASGEAIKNGYMAGYYDGKSVPGAPKAVKVYDTNTDNVQAVYRKAVAEGANFVVGPLTHDQVESVEKIGNLPVPTLALNYTPTAGKGTRNHYQFALSPQDEARQVAKVARQSGHTKAIIIAPANSWGQGVANTFRKAWTEQGGVIVDSLSYNKQTRLDQSIKKLLRVVEPDRDDRKNSAAASTDAKAAPERRDDVDMIFLVAAPTVARQVKPLLRFYYAANIPVYATSQVYSGHANPLQDKDLNSIRFCDIPWILDKNNSNIRAAHQEMQELLPHARPQSTRLYAFGLDAYTLTTELYRAPSQPRTIPGMTGMLYLGDGQQIFRQLQWAQFRNGEPYLIPGG